MAFKDFNIEQLKKKCDEAHTSKKEAVIIENKHGEDFLCNADGSFHKLGGGSGLPANTIIYREDGTIFYES